ncbi:MAG TPA: cobyric acid synthase [Acidisarcina sp.]|nr:cobyric acid synthase [Acidisarcina sp.]
MTRTPAIMVLGTGSHVGKSLITAALCRAFSQAGFRVAPFKAQNMSLNSAATPEGLEIGRAQALQAEAAGIPASVHMNPVLLKPSSDTASQVIVRGKIFAQFSAEDYFHRRNEELLPLVQDSYEILAAQYELMVLEGAGSPAEINLKDRDIANLRMAQLAHARCILVGDIDRGGVFASIFGTLALLEPAERDLIDGFVINKFRGDLRLLLPGIRQAEERIGKPCLGVIPYMPDLRLDEEDSVALDSLGRARWSVDDSPERRLRIAIVQFPSISNFTDFDPILAEPSVDARFCQKREELHAADLIILPGSKQTVSDLRWMRANGLGEAIRSRSDSALLFGICGGMQMLGASIDDPYEVETEGTEQGLGLLPIRTRMNAEKVTREAAGDLAVSSLFGESLECATVQGYEIHVGETEYLEGALPLSRISRSGNIRDVVLDGCVSRSGRVAGTYLHAIFQQDAFRHAFLCAARSACGLAPAKMLAWKQLREREFERLAHTVTSSVDISRLLGFVGLKWPADARKDRSCASGH